MLEVSGTAGGEKLRDGQGPAALLRLWSGSTVVAVWAGDLVALPLGLGHARQQEWCKGVRLAEEAREGASSLTCCRDPPGLCVPVCQMRMEVVSRIK